MNYVFTGNEAIDALLEGIATGILFSVAMIAVAAVISARRPIR